MWVSQSKPRRKCGLHESCATSKIGLGTARVRVEASGLSRFVPGLEEEQATPSLSLPAVTQLVWQDQDGTGGGGGATEPGTPAFQGFPRALGSREVHTV